MKILTERVLAKELKEGDLFSDTDIGRRWSENPYRYSQAVAVELSIRTATPLPDDELEMPMFRITIE